MSTALDLPCLSAIVPDVDEGCGVNPVPHEVVPGAAYSVIVPTDHGLITLDVVVLNRCVMMASKAYYGEGWRRIEHGMLSIAIRAVAGPAATSCVRCSLARPSASAQPDPLA